MRLSSSLRARVVRLALAIATPLLIAAPALAVTDRRAVDGAVSDVGPAVPEPSSILLFLIGVGIVGYGVHRRRAR
jgi:hypothetical protein